MSLAEASSSPPPELRQAPFGSANLRPEELAFVEARMQERDAQPPQAYEQPINHEEYAEDFSNWLNGNLDPETGMQTFYRFVYEPAVEAVQQYGGVTSRVVQNFGAGSEVAAYDALRQLSEGQVTEDIKAVFANFRPFMDRHRHSGGRLKDQRDAVDNLLSDGQVGDLIKEYAVQAAAEIAAPADPDALFGMAIHDSNSGSPRRGTFEELFYGALHFTSKADLNKADASWNHATHRITVKVYPGQLAPTGRFEDGAFVGEFHDIEWEWTGFGAIYPINDEQIIVERVQDIKSD